MTTDHRELLRECSAMLNALPQAASPAQPSNEDCGPDGGAPTPETDAFESNVRPMPGESIAAALLNRYAILCRKLERERDEARNQVALLVRVFRTVEAIPTMTDEQLAELLDNCKEAMKHV